MRGDGLGGMAAVVCILPVAKDMAQIRASPRVNGSRRHAPSSWQQVPMLYHLASSEDKQSQGSELYLGAGPHVGECLQFGRTAWAQAFGMVCGVDKRGNHEGD